MELPAAGRRVRASSGSGVACNEATKLRNREAQRKHRDRQKVRGGALIAVLQGESIGVRESREAMRAMHTLVTMAQDGHKTSRPGPFLSSPLTRNGS